MAGYKPTRVIVIIIMINFIGSALSRMIDEELPVEEWAKLFPGSGTEVLEYDIIPVQSSRIQKRDADQGYHIEIKAFGEHIKLWLNPTDKILAGLETPVFTILPDFDIMEHRHTMMDTIKMFYEDLEHAAALSINETLDGLTELNGIINSKNIYIRPIPDNYVIHARRYRRSIGDESELDSSDYKYHIAFKLSEEPKHMKNFEKRFVNSLRSKRSLVDTIYPELMIIVDYPLYMLLGANINKVVAYILTFWSAVDLKYRTIQNPKIRLNIAGIMIAKSPESLSYTNIRTRYEPYDTLIDNVLEASSEWLVELEKSIPTQFDAAITMTSEHFCVINGYECVRGSLGVAFSGGICSLPKKIHHNGETYFKTLKTAIVNDRGGYYGVSTAAHELGHLINAKHDGANNTCNGTSGHIMGSKLGGTSNSSDWSSCSIQYFDEFLNSGNASCLFNKPQISKAFATFLPGQIRDANEQCYRLEGTSAAFIDATTCIELICVSKYNRFETTSYGGVVDGTRCGDRKICLHSRCIHEADITS